MEWSGDVEFGLAGWARPPDQETVGASLTRKFPFSWLTLMPYLKQQKSGPTGRLFGDVERILGTL